MVPAPSCQFSWDYWAASPSDDIELICLMPNSVYIPLKASWDSTLHEVKEELWERAGKYPLYGMLHESAGYVFRFINSLADAEEVDDESKRIRDIKPVCGVLNIIKRSERPGEQFLNTQISHLIGKGLVEFDSLKNSEVNHFRTQMRYLAERSIAMRPDISNRLGRLKYECPPRVAHPKQRDEIVPKTLISHLKNYSFFLVTKVDVDVEGSFSSNVHASTTPHQHIENILARKTRPFGILGDADRYVLKVCGREEYLLDNYPLIQYLYIQEVLSRDGVPQVMLVNIDNLPVSTQTGTTRIRLTSEPNTNTSSRIRRTESSWNIDKNYSCTVKRVSGLNVDPSRPGEVICQVGIFHGGKPICEVQKTPVVVVSAEGVAEWGHTLHFPIKVLNLPRMARLCFGIKKLGKDNKDNVNKLAWANTMIFDYKEELRRDGDTLFMWTHVADETQGDDILLHPLGTVVSNPSTDSCAALEVRFSHYDCKYPIVFPSKEEVRARGEEIQRGMPDLAADFKLMNITARQDPTYEMHEQERKDVWAAREYFRRHDPDFLPKLLNCVEWCERDEAATVAHMLGDWPRFSSVEYALELLDYAYADAAVRSFAVQCLESMSDEDLLLYLLQLVQALKHESYLMCDLAEFLLKRAFNNMTIGHYLFWHLRSEMHGPVGPWVSVRFGLILEAYLRGSQDHISVLSRQLSCVDKLKWVIECVKKHKDITRARAALESHLKEQHCLETLNNFVSPLNPSHICKEIIPEKCRVMDSKMRPLMLEFENSDPSGNEIRIIMKVGDDLRQDMFTLQMLRIMDQIWKNSGYDFKLNPYNCISIEYKVGMIEVVEDAQTVANIQKQKAKFNATSAMSKDNILQWLKEKNASESAFNKAVDEFTMSCAGYCVATYVLGIADRHPDNIMIKESGHLFHIDFGHFLGHFKHKYGIRRERAPFVLTHNFIHVINKGQKGSGDLLDFKIFREHCEMAFRILRRHGHLILSLFSMMISTGLPELRSEKDLQHLRDTLVLDLPEDKAIKHFHSKFDEAVKNAGWPTKIDWTFHNLSRNN